MKSTGAEPTNSTGAASVPSNTERAPEAPVDWTDDTVVIDVAAGATPMDRVVVGAATAGAIEAGAAAAGAVGADVAVPAIARHR